MAITNNRQQADTGTKMIHLGKNTKSLIISKGISAGDSTNSYRGLVRTTAGATNSRNYSQCDSLLLGSCCYANTYPVINNKNISSVIEHEATTSKVSEEVLLYMNQRGINTEDAMSMIIQGYAKEIIQNLPMEFAVEAKQLLSMSIQGVG